MRKTILVLVITLLVLISAIMINYTNYKNNKKESISISRELQTGDTYIILKPCTPLNNSLQNEDVCIELFNKINEYRLLNKVSELCWNNELQVAATTRATEASILWSHIRPDGSDYYTVAPNIVWGENLAKGYDNIESVLEGWKSSPSHNQNLLCSEYKYVAIAKYRSIYACEFCY